MGALRWIVILISLGGCQPSREERCAQLLDELDGCVGTRLPRLDCSTVSDADIDRLRNLIEGTSCRFLAGAVPVDGDYLSAACRLFGIGCVAPVTEKPVHAPTRYPILLVNGIDTSPFFRYSDRILQVMHDQGGQDVYLATLTPYQPPVRRAPELWRRISQVRMQTGAQKVNLICHSLGGLDCRYVASPAGLGADLGTSGLAQSIASITTIGTAHRGTRIADVVLGLLPDGDRGKAFDDLASLLGDWFSPQALDRDADLRAALGALSLSQAPAFNAAIVDAPEVFYQSYAGYSRPFGEATKAHDDRLATLCRTADGGTGLPKMGQHDYMALPLLPLTDVVGGTSGPITPNDGICAVDSARWGTFRGCIPADHMEQLGQHNLPDVNVRTGQDMAWFYADLGADLARRGF